MAGEVFVDTSGFYALLVKRDDRHEAARRLLRRAKAGRQRFVTTDYVLDESATLLKARGLTHILKAFFETVAASTVCRVEWMDADRFAACQAFFLKHQDQPWSFTDCVSFHLMRELRLKRALTKDAHFEGAGFIPLLK